MDSVMRDICECALTISEKSFEIAYEKAIELIGVDFADRLKEFRIKHRNEFLQCRG